MGAEKGGSVKKGRISDKVEIREKDSIREKDRSQEEDRGNGKGGGTDNKGNICFDGDLVYCLMADGRSIAAVFRDRDFTDGICFSGLRGQSVDVYLYEPYILFWIVCVLAAVYL